MPAVASVQICVLKKHNITVGKYAFISLFYSRHIISHFITPNCRKKRWKTKLTPYAPTLKT
jgi:hypothetical protein